MVSPVVSRLLVFNTVLNSGLSLKISSGLMLSRSLSHAKEAFQHLSYFPSKVYSRRCNQTWVKPNFVCFMMRCSPEHPTWKRRGGRGVKAMDCVGSNPILVVFEVSLTSHPHMWTVSPSLTFRVHFSSDLKQTLAAFIVQVCLSFWCLFTLERVEGNFF